MFINASARFKKDTVTTAEFALIGPCMLGILNRGSYMSAHVLLTLL